MATYLDTICQNLADKKPMVLISNISQKGAIPRAINMRMTVALDGTIRGTVGGGSYEVKAVEAAKALIAAEVDRKKNAPCPAKLLRFSMTGLSDADLSPISGGSVDFLIELLPPSLSPMFAEAAERARQGKHFVFVVHASFSGDAVECSFPPTGAITGMVERNLYGDNAWYKGAGGFTPPPDAQHYLRGTYLRDSQQHCYYEENQLWILAPFDPYPKAIIFGSGHVSSETAALADKIGFVTMVVDDKPEMLTLQRFPNAETVVLSGYSDKSITSWLMTNALCSKDAIFILTRGVERGLAALSAALATEAGYIGLHASPAEKEEIYAALRKQGVPEERLAFVRFPIGLPIKAEIPEESAVAIIAEIIAWRSNKGEGYSSFMRK